jgi:uncharacterized lipoprotein YmbA
MPRRALVVALLALAGCGGGRDARTSQLVVSAIRQMVSG